MYIKHKEKWGRGKEGLVGLTSTSSLENSSERTLTYKKEKMAIKQRNTCIESSIKVHNGVQTMYVCIEVTIQQLFTALGGGNGTLW